MDELQGKWIACQILLAGLIARVANEQRDPIGFLSDFRDEIHAVISGLRLAGAADDAPLRISARHSVDELFSLMKAPGAD